MANMGSVPKAKPQEQDWKAGHASPKVLDVESGQSPIEGEVHNYSVTHDFNLAQIRNRWPLLARLHAVDKYLGGKIGIEAMGIDWIPEDQRNPPDILNMLLLWFTMNITPGFLVVGALGVGMGLSINETMGLTFAAAAIASLAPAWCATFCPQTGLRQIAVSRFAFGIQGAKICSIANCVINIGCTVGNAIIAGQLLVAVSSNTIPEAVGIIVVIVISWGVSFFGFRAIHQLMRYAWVIPFVLTACLWGQSAKYWKDVDKNAKTAYGMDYAGSCWTFFALCFGSTIAWSTMAVDFYVRYPADISKLKVLSLTYLGLPIPYTFCLPVGVLLRGAIIQDATLLEIYGNGNLGGVIQAIMTPKGWGNFACICFFLSMVGNQSAITYSSSLSIQLLDKYLFAVPRFIWNTFISAICLGLAWGGKNSLAAIIANFSAMLGYYIISFVDCMMIENHVFRPQLGGYNAEGWREQSIMPVGLAGTTTLLAGFGLAFAGMTQTWFISPISLLISLYGGDVGDYLVMGDCLVMYPVLRWLEIKRFGRQT